MTDSVEAPSTGITSDEAEIVRRAPTLPESALSSSVDEKEAMRRVLSLLKGKVIEVEGNIGCGKSTLTTHLSKLVGLETGDEALSILHGEKVNHEFLKAFYDEPKRMAFAFQMYMLTTRLYQMDEATRGAVGDILFALNNHVSGNITDGDLAIYRSVCRERLPSTLSDNVDLVVYLDVSPMECWHRMTSVRQREAEASVPPDYLYDIDNVYFELLIEWLGQRGGRYYDMNVGKAPPLAVLRWENFGCARSVAQTLAGLVDGSRRSPDVKFMDALPAGASYDLAITCPADAEAIWAVLQPALAAGAQTVQLGATTLDLAAPAKLSLAWDMDRKKCEAYRRVALWALSTQSTLHFHGEGAVVRPQ
jgi:deoxyadenosine/deoxycytidine kinase